METKESSRTLGAGSMFRKGGSAAESVGITSGLRKKYEEGTNPYEENSLGIDLGNYPYDTDMEEGEDLGMNLSATTNANVVNPNMDMTREAYARQLRQSIEKQSMPTYRDQVLDFLTAFGASAAPAGQFQTISDALGKTGKNFQTIFDPKIQRAKQAGMQGYLAGLKGADKEKLLKYQRMAEDMARIKGISYDEALKTVLARELGDKDRSEDIIEKIAQGKVSSGIDYPSARAEAEIEYKITRDPEYAQQIKGRFKGSISPNKFMPDANGNYVFINPQQKSNIRVNDVFVDPNTKKLYYFDGKKLVPTK
jgi:hypothetical protein